MGKIKDQAIKGTIYTYIGVGIGFITTALIFPRILSKEEIGLLGLLISYSAIFAQLASLGTSRVVVIAFPYFQSKEHKHHGLLFIILAVTGIGFIISIIAFYFLREYLIAHSHESSQLVVRYFHYLLPLILFTLIFMVLDSYYKVLQKAVIGTALKEFVQRLLFLVFIIIYYYGYLNFGQYVLFYVASICFPAVVLIVSLIKDREFFLKPDLKFVNKDLRKLMIQVGLYGIPIGFSAIIITNFDRIMVERFLDIGATGIYMTTSFFATLVIMPSRALLKISDPFISQSWKNNDLDHLLFLYKKTSMSQLVIGALLFIGIWANQGNIFRILPPAYEPGRYVIFFIGLAFMFDMISGAAGLILANSKYFRYYAYNMIMLIVLVVVTNFIFIPIFGLAGAAFATCLSKFIMNLVLFLFLNIKYKLQPYSLKYLWVILIAMIAYLAGYFVPASDNLYFDIFYRSALITIVYVGLLLLSKAYPELNERYAWLTGIVRDFRKKRKPGD
jgi:O-antigen/teichoic acid export membrane protein